QLETRCVPTSVPPGNYSGTFASDTEFDQAGTYVINGNLTVANGVTLTVGRVGVSVNLLINANQTITDNGTLNIINGAPVVAQDGSTAGSIVVNGAMNVSGASFTRSGNLAFTNTTLQVGAGGHLTASNSTFAW